MKPKIVSLAKAHDRAQFNCGKNLLDNYLKHQARQDVQKKISACFVLIETENKREVVKGYYTLSNAGISREIIPAKYSKKFPPTYQSIPVTLLGRLAVDSSCFGKGLGEYLLMDALYKSYDTAKKVASFAVIVDPIDDEAISFYAKYDFILLPDSGKMILPMAVIESVFKG